MNTASIHTQKSFGLDYRVWLAMLVSWALCLVFLGYRNLKHNINGAGCAFDSITVDGKKGANVVCDLNRYALFQLQAGAGAKTIWDFNDGTAPYKGTHTAQHRFSREGIYSVTATVNGRCQYTAVVTVKEPVYILPVKPEVKIFADSVNAIEGSRLRFSGASNQRAKSFVWTLRETGEVKTGETVIFFFGVPGEYTLQLMVDNDPTRTDVKPIKIFEKAKQMELPGAIPNPANINELGPLVQGSVPVQTPPGGGQGAGRSGPTGGSGHPPADSAKAAPTVPEATAIDEGAFANLLQEVLQEKQPLEALYPFLWYKGSTQVEVNGKQPYMSLQNFYTKKRGKKIKNLQFQPEKDNPKRIQTIKVELKGGLFGTGLFD